MSKSLGQWRPGSWVPKIGVQLKCQQQQKEVGKEEEEEAGYASV